VRKTKDATRAKTRNVGILIFDDVEVLDFCGPFEVFAVTGRQSDAKPFHVYTIAERRDPVAARGGLSVNPTHTLADCPRPDVLVVPGGFGTRRLMEHKPVIDWIRGAAGEAELVLSVCTGALLLGKAGLLDGQPATTHHAALELLRQAAPRAAVRGEQRIVDNGALVISAGISAGIDAALHVVSRLVGEGAAAEAAAHMEYDWRTVREV
jgi:transcriptional regulator GlxA family with amidase domain